jgi:cytochrome c2
MRRLIALALMLSLTACSGHDRHAVAKALIAAKCAGCHTVPGVRSAVGMVGPPLAGIAGRQIIAGKFANTPGNMERWIMHPQHYLPGNAMPDTGITAPQAKLITDYLNTLDQP